MVRISYCDSINEEVEIANKQRQLQQEAQQRQLVERQRIEESNRRIAEAQAEQRAAEQRAREAREREARFTVSQTEPSATERPSFAKHSVPVNIGTVAAAFAIFGLWLYRVWRADHVKSPIKATVSVLVPLAQTLLLHSLGIKDEITIGEMPLLALPFGLGELVLALNYKLAT